MKVVFLDIDGVLNSADRWEQCVQVGRHAGERLDQEAVARLNRLCDDTGAMLVISSTWRLLDGFADLNGMLTRGGITGRIIGCTPRISGEQRGVEISAWLRGQGLHLVRPQPVESFVILDDDSDMDALSHRLVKTSFETGLLDEHVAAAIEMLREPSQVPA